MTARRYGASTTARSLYPDLRRSGTLVLRPEVPYLEQVKICDRLRDLARADGLGISRHRKPGNRWDPRGMVVSLVDPSDRETIVSPDAQEGTA